MRRMQAIFNTDQVNRAQMICPAKELMRGDQRHYQQSFRRGTDVGLPTHIQHDMHRPFGWSRPLGLHIDSTMVRVLGLIEAPETEQEVREFEAKIARYWTYFHHEGTEDYRDDLIARVAPASLEGGQFLRMEAAVVKRPDIAKELYPNLFTIAAGLVDKDGLTDYRALLARMREIQPGVFHDPNRDLLLFAHRMFRRRLSHRNKLNDYFLRSFHASAANNAQLSVRLRLDPDLIGHPSSAKALIELEHWRGPHYSDDIATIPSGVAEHKADERSRFYEGIDRTHVWWKSPEQRVVDGELSQFRTFEVEELIENPSGGLSYDHYGCRYAHAEYSLDQVAITHFDGAIRSYTSEAYLRRIDTSIDRAGKHSAYTKLFRFDGHLPITEWKRLLSDFFRGNKLIPEYLGAPIEVDNEDEAGTPLTKPSEPVASDVTLSALIHLDNRCLGESTEGTLTLYPELFHDLDGELIPYVEVGTGAVEVYLRSKIDLSNITTIGVHDSILNLSRLVFRNNTNLKTTFDEEIPALAASLRKDTETGTVKRASVPMTWQAGHLLVTLTIAGEAEKVTTALAQLPNVINPTQMPSEWIEGLSTLIKATEPKAKGGVSWHGINRGVLAIERFGEADVQMQLPDELLQKLKELGKLQIDTSNVISEPTSEQ